MFSTKSQLKKKTPEDGTDRENFLSLLVDEYLNSVSHDAKCQVLANLANFAYDPINYGFIRDVGVLDIFLYVLKNETNEILIQYASAGICNLCLDFLNAQYILEKEGLKILVSALQYTNIELKANIVTTLLYILNNDTKADIINTGAIQEIKKLQHSPDKRLSNLATIFLQDVNTD